MKIFIFLFLICTGAFAVEKVSIFDQKGNEAHSLKRPSSTDSRTYTHKTFYNVTGDSVIHSVTAGKVFYMTSIGANFINTNTGANASVIFRDTFGSTTTNKLPIAIQSAVAAALVPETVLAMSFPEPVQFASTVGISVITGTVVGNGFFTGYEE